MLAERDADRGRADAGRAARRSPSGWSPPGRRREPSCASCSTALRPAPAPITAADPEAARKLLARRRVASPTRRSTRPSWPPTTAVASVILNLDETITKE